MIDWFFFVVIIAMVLFILFAAISLARKRGVEPKEKDNQEDSSEDEEESDEEESEPTEPARDCAFQGEWRDYGDDDYDYKYACSLTQAENFCDKKICPLWREHGKEKG